MRRARVRQGYATSELARRRLKFRRAACDPIPRYQGIGKRSTAAQIPGAARWSHWWSPRHGSPRAHAASSPASGIAGQKFMALSLFATGRSKLDPEIGTKLYAALHDSDASFAGLADSLAPDAASGRYADVESLELAIRGTPKHAALLALVAAWYTGTGSVH